MVPDKETATKIIAINKILFFFSLFLFFFFFFFLFFFFLMGQCLPNIKKIETAKNGGNVKEVMDKALEEYIRKYLPDKL